MKRQVTDRVREQLKILNPGKKEEAVLLAYCDTRRKKAAAVLIGAVGLALFLTISQITGESGIRDGRILRDSYGGSTQTIETVVQSESFEDIKLDIVVENRSYTEKETKELFDEAQRWLEQEILGENEDFGHISKPLRLPDSYREGQIGISYESSNDTLLDDSGEVCSGELKEAEEVVLTACLSYGEQTRECRYPMTIYPASQSGEEAFRKEVSARVAEEEKAQREEEVFYLPEEIGGEAVVFRQKREHTGITVMLLGIVCAVLVYKGADKDLDRLFEERKQKLLFAYPEFASKLALLVGAGMHVSGAIRRICRDYGEDGGGESVLSGELKIFVRCLDNGMTEETAIETLGRRTGLSEYRKFCSLLSENMKKGSMNLAGLLENEANEAFAAHQTQIRKMGEEAGTKLLIPMMMMLIVVIVIIMIPAFMNYQVA